MPSADPSLDAGQDAELRAVPLPEGLLQRLRGAPLADDEGLDAMVREVPVPRGLLRRLRHSALATDEGLDAAIRGLPVPVELPGRFDGVPNNRIRLTRLTRLAAATLLLVTIGLAYLGAMVGFLAATYPYPADMPRRKLLFSPMVELSGQSEQPQPDFGVVISSGRGESEEATFGGSPAPVAELKLAEFEEPRSGPSTELRDLFSPEAAADLFLDAGLHRWGVLTAHNQFDDLPELKLVAGLIPRGIDWPLVPGSNPHILIRYGVHPFVSPASHPRLFSSLVPLGVDASSYELTRRHLEDGKLPPPGVVRTEEFLAAVDYRFPRPKRHAMGLSTAVGPSPFGGPGLRLMQIGVQARHFQDRQHQPTYLVLAVDISASMRWGGRLEMIRRALSELIGWLGPGDRISLVTFSEDAQVLLEGRGRDEADRLRAVIELLSTQSSTNLGAGLRQAHAVAQHEAAFREVAIRVVLLTDGLAELGRGTRDRIKQRLSDAADREIILEVIDLGQEKETDPQLASFAQSGGGKVYRATNVDQVRWAFLEILTGSSQLMAADARLKVTFNPKTVLEYRLLGHEAKAMAGLMPAHPEADLHAGQSATALYEIRLKPGGGQNVATVELTWRDPKGDRPRTLTRHVRRKQFDRSFIQAPLSLQVATLVAETAEVLRESPYALGSWSSRSAALAGVLQLAGQVDTRLYERPTFVEFISLVEQAEKAKPYRRGQEGN